MGVVNEDLLVEQADDVLKEEEPRHGVRNVRENECECCVHSAGK